MKIWRIGLIGCGWAGEQHTKAIQRHGLEIVLTAVADIDINLAVAKAKEWQVPHWTDDYRTILDTDIIDAVSICLPHDLHATVAVEAMKMGLHVLVEKPLATSLAEADVMIAAAKNYGRTLMVAENVRFDRTYLKVVDLIESGGLGDMFMIRIAREHEMHGYLQQRPWFLQQDSAGIMVSGGVHDFELLRMLGGEIEHVYGLVGRKMLSKMKADDTSIALVGLCNGVTAVLVESFSLKTPQPGVHGSVHGRLGSIWFHGECIQLYNAAEDGQQELIHEIHVPTVNTFDAEIAHFVDCLNNSIEPITNGETQRHPLAAVVATYDSFTSGRREYL